MGSAELPDSGLSVQQKSIIRRAFRQAYLIQDEARRNHAITGVYIKFAEMYGISRDEVRAIVQKVKNGTAELCTSLLNKVECDSNKIRKVTVVRFAGHKTKRSSPLGGSTIER